MRDMYVVPPPPPDPAAGGVTSAGRGDASSGLRTYQVWKGSNTFLLQGRLIFGPDARSVLLTMFLIVAPVAVFCVFVARKLMDDFHHHLGISIIVVVVVLTVLDLVFLLLTSGRDPGLHAVLIVQYAIIALKDLTITALGLRNYRFFFSFVFSSTIICLYVHAFCWVYIKRIMDSEETTIWKAMTRTPASIALVAYTFVSVWFVGGLTVFHLYLISKNQSTYENFRYRYDGLANAFDKGLIGNFKEVFLSSIPASKNNFRAKVPKEPEFTPRMVGGASHISPNMEKSVGDIEMGRKPVWDETARESDDDDDEAVRTDGSLHDGGLPDVSPDLSRMLPPQGMEGRSVLHSRRSSLGRVSGNWEMPPDVVALAGGVGESKRVPSCSSSILTAEDQKSDGRSKLYYTGDEA
ncbi:hypothetical protein Tsubulata_000617 [Turnera subulata]|uniref:S-acyltransferase n=1 Tax=Turnera subulata TaxID=218843 RepID=A0A9Q0JQA8_9ROSI|nr:hypothetical protein Tsubulata_000617 [Turnera subulata]